MTHLVAVPARPSRQATREGPALRSRRPGGGERYFRVMERDAVVQSVFQPVRAPTTFEETVERLGTAIRAGILPAGSRLPAERMLADQLAISRSTLRQALTALAQSGHLLSLGGGGGGTFVTERPPLAETDAPPLGNDAWAVL